MSFQPRITLVVAMAKGNRGIGRKNALPWRLPGDMKLFRENTLNKTILMGRLTAESIGNALPKRRNLVLTSRDSAPFPGQIAVRSLEEAMNEVADELIVIGGQQVYALALPFASKLCITEVDLDVPDADAFFPAFDEQYWRTTRFDHFAAEGKYPAYTYFEKQRPAPRFIP